MISQNIPTLAALVLIACGTVQHAEPLAQVDDKASKMPTQSSAAPATPRVIARIPGQADVAEDARKWKTNKMARHLFSATGETHVLAKRCAHVEGICDLQSVQLVLDGNPIDFPVGKLAPSEPYGNWDDLGVAGSRRRYWLHLKSDDVVIAIEISVEAGVLVAKDEKRWPTTTREVLQANTDWVGNGAGEDISFECQTRATSSGSRGCKGLVLKHGSTVVHEDKKAFFPGTPTVLLFEAPNGKTVLRLSWRSEQESDGIYIGLYGLRKGKLGRLWSRKLRDYGGFDANVESFSLHEKPDGAWTTTEVICEEPGVLYSTTKKYKWQGAKMIQKTKRKPVRKSKCTNTDPS